MTVIADTAWIVAFLDGRDRYHPWAKDQANQYPPPYFTCESVLSEAHFLLQRIRGATSVLRGMIEDGAMDVSFSYSGHVHRVHKLLRKYFVLHLMPPLARCALLVFVILLFVSHESIAQVVLNEIMASNQETVQDDDGDFSDWIELYNAGSEPVMLHGYGLSDDYDDPFRWTMPAFMLGPGAFLLIWASGKDRRAGHLPLHTNFSIQSTGEEILLTDPEGTRVDELSPTPIPRDVSLGRRPDGIGEWFYFREPTPGAANTTEGYQDLLDPPVFSHAAGFYADDVTLTLSSSAPSAVIRYTLDGSEPTAESPAYSEPLRIANRTNEPNELSEIRTYYHEEAWKPPAGDVFKATVVRARAFQPGAVTSASVTNTYFVDRDVDARYGLPIVSIATDRDGFFDHERGIYVPGARYEEGGPWTGNYFRRGRDWERPVSIETFEPDGSLAFAQNAGVRIHGGFSRAVPFKTLRIYARREYDAQNWINYRIFPDRDLTSFKRILLRNSGNDWGGHPWATFNNSDPGTLFRDAMMQRLVEHMNVETQGYRPSVLFLNGEFWGIHNFRQRYDRYYFETNYAIVEEELDLLTQNRSVKHGSRSRYDEMMDFVESANMRDDETIRELRTWMDVDNYLDYFISNVYFDNTDWPHNNIDFWRYRSDRFFPGALPGRDGRWRWLMFDTDFGFGLSGDHNPGGGFSRNTMAHAVRTGDRGWSTLLFRKLLENDGVRHDFINRFAGHLNTSFAPERVVAVIDEMRSAIAHVMPEQIHRWGYPASMDRWEANVQVVRTFAEQRPVYVRTHVATQFELPGTWEMTVDVSDPAAGYVRVNRLHLKPGTPGVSDVAYPWTGTYFRRVPVTLAAMPAPGYRFVRWEGGALELLEGDASESPGVGQQASQTIVIMQETSQPASVTAIFEPDDGDPMHPVAYDLSLGPYELSTWWSDQPAHTYPPNVVFQQTSTADPGLHDEMESVWSLPYDLDSRSRVVGLDEFGIAFINTANVQDVEGAGHVGAAVLALNTEGVDSVYVTWTGATPRPNSRVYNLRLQYRVGTDAPFRDVLDRSGNPVEYRRSPLPGHAETIGPQALPADVAGRPYVQLRWKYYHTGERLDAESGQRTMLRLADVHVAASLGGPDDEPGAPLPDRTELIQNYPNPFNTGTRIEYALAGEARVRIAVYDVLGREVAVLVEGAVPAGKHAVDWNGEGLPSGVYFYRMEADGFVQARQMTVLK